MLLRIEFLIVSLVLRTVVGLQYFGFLLRGTLHLYIALGPCSKILCSVRFLQLVHGEALGNMNSAAWGYLGILLFLRTEVPRVAGSMLFRLERLGDTCSHSWLGNKQGLELLKVAGL